MSERAGAEAIARVVHEALRAWALANGEAAHPPWSRAPKWMRESSAESVRFTLDNPDAPTSAQHDQWMAQRLEQGWVFGAVKDAEKKTHPMLVPYEELPEYEKDKDRILNALALALGGKAKKPIKNAAAKSGAKKSASRSSKAAKKPASARKSKPKR